MLSRAMMAPGTVLRITAYRGEKKDYVGKVVEVVDTHSRPVQQKTHERAVKTRSQYRVTLESVNPSPGTPKAKAYYHAFAQAEVIE